MLTMQFPYFLTLAATHVGRTWAILWTVAAESVVRTAESEAQEWIAAATATAAAATAANTTANSSSSSSSSSTASAWNESSASKWAAAVTVFEDAELLSEVYVLVRTTILTAPHHTYTCSLTAHALIVPYSNLTASHSVTSS